MLTTRLNILAESEIISNSIKDKLLLIIEMFHDEYKIRLTEENGAMMITHLAMAIGRVQNEEPIKKIDEEIYQELLDSEHYLKSIQIYKKLINILELELPEDEEKYMLINICIILNNAVN